MMQGIYNAPANIPEARFCELTSEATFGLEHHVHILLLPLQPETLPRLLVVRNQVIWEWVAYLFGFCEFFEMFDVIEATRPHAGRHPLRVAHARACPLLDQKLKNTTSCSKISILRYMGSKNVNKNSIVF